MVNIINEFKFYIFLLRKNFSNEKALRLSFGVQIFGMILNNLAFYVIWYFFTKAIGETNGWGVKQTFGLVSVCILTYGITFTLFGGIGSLQDKILSGSFDSLLTRPKSLYLRILNQQFSSSAVGDTIQGLIGICIFFAITQASFGQIAILVLMLPPAVLVFASFSMIGDCIVFWFQHAEGLNRAFSDLILLPATQPITLLTGFMKFLYIFIIPAMLMAGMPTLAYTQSNWKMVVLSYAIAIVWFMLSKYVLARSLNKYESANYFG